jgi:hypothetical protein|nr:MAG TPA: hypothetical protein [Caudoviricetes sp.]DAV43156.1 MAG TPA: hypothetical protein [Caudoviricetes sp.]
MPKWTEYTSKDTLADNDEVMLYDATARANKRGLMSKFWDYVVDKMSTAVIGKLETENKTIIGALNTLNSDRFSIYEKQVSDLDNPPAAFILNTGINPKGLPELSSNGCCVIQHNPGSETYTAQLAFSFGCEKIAIRTKKSDSWSNWKYFSAQ